MLILALLIASWGGVTAVRVHRLSASFSGDIGLLWDIELLDQALHTSERAFWNAGADKAEIKASLHSQAEGVLRAGGIVMGNLTQSEAHEDLRQNVKSVITIARQIRDGMDQEHFDHTDVERLLMQAENQIRTMIRQLRDGLSDHALKLASSRQQLMLIVLIACLLAVVVALLFVALDRSGTTLSKTRYELREAEQQLRTIISAAPIILFMIDEDRSCLLVEGKGLEQLEAESFAGKPIWSLLGSGEQIRELVDKAFAGEPCFQQVSVMDQMLEVWLMPAQAEPDGQIRVSGVATNVTERLVALKALHESEDRYRTLSGLTSDFVYASEVEPDGRVVLSWANSAFVAATGYTPKELTAAGGWRRLMHPDDLAILEKQMADLLSGQVIRGQRRIVTKSGVIRWVRVVNYPITDPQTHRVIQILGAAQDITEQRQAERSLRQTEERYRLLVEQSPDAIIVHLAWKIVFTNQAGAELLGAGTPAELIGKPILDFIHKDIQKSAKAHIQAAYEGDTGHPLSESCFIKIDGTSVDVEVAGGGCSYLGRNAAQVVARDITERKEHQHRQTRLMRELDHRVKNNLATVLAIAEQSALNANDLEVFLESFRGRIQALSRLHEMLARDGWKQVELGEIVMRCTQMFADQSGRVQISGQSVMVPSRVASALTMTLHELITNAAKYGALSVSKGKVTVKWSMGEALEIEWLERDGPKVCMPMSRGFGMELIEAGIAYDCGGTVDVDFSAEGLSVKMRIPKAWLDPEMS